eukprot:scaffold135424_cov47-Attheya_sp.AAC.1
MITSCAPNRQIGLVTIDFAVNLRNATLHHIQDKQTLPIKQDGGGRVDDRYQASPISPQPRQNNVVPTASASEHLQC